MKKILVSTATNKQLDWLVAILTYGDEHDRKRVFLHCTGYEGARHYVRVANQDTCEVHLSFEWHPTIDWNQMGPIIEREIDELSRYTHYPDYVARRFACDNWDDCEAVGPTPLIAAARCYIVSKMGEEVLVPDELTPGEIT